MPNLNLSRSVWICTILSLGATFLLFSVAPMAFAQTTLSMTLAVDPTFDIDANGNQTYTATVTNTGTGDAPNLTVTFALPGDDIPISPPASGGCSFTPGSSLVATCSIALLNPGQSHDFVIVVHPTAVSQKDVSAIATESGGGSANASVSSQIIEVGISDMQVILSDSPDPAQVAVPMTYTVTGTNLGDDSAGQVVLTLTLPTGVQFISMSHGCTRAGFLVSCRAGSLSPGISKSFSVSVMPQVSGWLHATAGVRLTTADPSFLNNSAAVRTWVSP
jgi:uncharacterized repeat protein (TIGR01451 family)